MFLIAGLGNPTSQYVDTRHNAGDIALRAIVEKHGLPFVGTKFNALAWKGRIGMRDVLAISPQTFMNRSGISVGEASRFYRVAPANIMILYDDLDLAPCKFRVKLGGGNGGHNGLKDIDRAIGVEYWRLRLGIGRPDRKEQVTNYVLGKFEKDERISMQHLADAVAKHIPLILDGYPEKLMSAVAMVAHPQ